MLRILVLFAALIAAAAPAQALDRPLTQEEEQLISAINAHNTAIDTMAGKFEQIDSQGRRAKGTFYIDRPNNVRFRYAPPSREEIVSKGSGFYVLNRKEKTRYAYPQEDIPLRQFLGSEINLFQANILDVVTTEDFITVTISDNTPIGVVEVALVFDIETKNLRQWTLTEPSGAEVTFSLYDVVTGVEIPKSFFYIDPTYEAINPARR